MNNLYCLGTIYQVFRKIFCLLLVFSFVSAHAETKYVEIEVGGVTIDIQAPIGFYEISSLSYKSKKVTKLLTVPKNRQLAFFVEEEDLGRIMKDETPKLKRYIILETNRKIESENYTKLKYKQLLTVIRKQQHTLFKNNKEKIDFIFKENVERANKTYDTSLNMKISDIIPLGVFLDQENAIGYASLIKYQGTINGKNFTILMVGSATLLQSKGKILFAFIRSKYESQEDLNWVRTKSKEWAKTIFNIQLETVASVIGEWKQEQLNEDYMRSITKEYCVKKTALSIEKCRTTQCLTNLGGIYGDCVEFAKGAMLDFCKLYKSIYISKYCNGLNDNKIKCLFFQPGEKTFCGS